MNQFLRRTRGECARVFHHGRDPQKDDDDTKDLCLETPPVGARHGDLWLNPDGYRGTTTYVICELPLEEPDEKEEVNEPKKKKKKDFDSGEEVESPWVIFAMDNSGYTDIPLQISRGLENPIEFYKAVTDKDLYQGVTRIAFCAEDKHHQQLLKQRAGDRTVDSRCRVWWSSYNDWEIALPTSPDRESIYDAANFNETTPVEYLTGEPTLEFDPLICREREKLRKWHEGDASVEYFSSLEAGASLPASNVPENSSNGSIAGRVKFVEFKQSVLHCKDRLGAYEFQLLPSEVEHGLYANIKVWSCKVGPTAGWGQYSHMMICKPRK